MIFFEGELLLKWRRMFNKRRPLDDDLPDGYMESDKDFVENNFELCVKMLEELETQLSLEEKDDRL